MPEFTIAELRKRAQERLIEASVEKEDAALLVDHLIKADLWGRKSHGLALRFKPLLELARKGAGRRRPRVRADSGNAVLVDANDGFGYLGGCLCVQLLIERTGKHGIATVSMVNSRHTGMLGYYVEKAARAGVVSFAFGNCCPLMAPYGGARALLGTNPLAIGFPASPDPVVIDMATSAISYGELAIKEKNGEPLPERCAIDAEGRLTRDPARTREGALLPFGGHKGGALALAVQVLAGVFTGAPAIPPKRRKYGLLLLGMAKGLFAGEEGYDEAMKELTTAYLSVPPLEGGEVRLPGSKRFENERKLRNASLNIPDELVKLLKL